MLITHFMLQSNPLVPKTFHFRAPFKWPLYVHLKKNHLPCYIVTKSFSQMRVECFFGNCHKTRGETSIDNHAKKVDSYWSEMIIWSSSMENVIKVLQKPVITGVVFLFGLLLIYDHQYALAASGGRMGGRSFSSSSSKSSSSSSDSYSSGSSSSRRSPSSESYSSRTSCPKSSRASSSDSYSSGSSSSRSPSSESYSSQTSSPYSSSYGSYSTWSSSPQSSSSGSYRSRPKSSSYESYSTHSSSSSTARPESAHKFGKPDVYFIVTLVTIVCVIAYFLNPSDAASRSSAASQSGTASRSGSATQSGVASRSDAATQSDATVKTSVLKLQVGLLGTAKSLQKDLNGVAEAADTSTLESLSFVLQETAVALLRHPDYCISGYSSVDVRMGVDECEKQFNQISIEERGKLDEETLVNVDNIKKQSVTSQRSSELPNEYIVVTIIVAAVGIYELPAVKNNAQLKQALQKLASVPSSKIMAAEVLWTPQKEDDSLSEKEMLEDYPLLRPL